jgi:hypothetical protein
LNLRSMTYVHNSKDFPREPHLAIIEFKSIYVPGDERSKQCPGHGYPAHNEPSMSYIVFKDRETWEEEIARCEKSRRDYIALDHGKVATVTQRIVTTVG